MTEAIAFRGTTTGVGSLPHTDVTTAIESVLRLCPELPAAPQLPRRSPAERMIAQVASSMSGVAIDAGGAITIPDTKRVAAPAPGSPLDADSWGTTFAFLDAVAGHPGPVKLQVAGPVTLGLALIHAGLPARRAFPLAAATIDHHVRILAGAAAAAAPDAVVVLVLDEPGLVAFVGGDMPIDQVDTIDLLSGRLASATMAAGSVLSGVHCCGATDWSVVLDAGPDLLSLPVEAAGTLDGAGLATFLERGGHVAWGAVPTDRPLGQRDEIHWRRLSELWCDLSRAGCDPLMLRDRALITPACGLAHHSETQVSRIFELVRHMGERVEDQSMAARLSAGA